MSDHALPFKPMYLLSKGDYFFLSLVVISLITISRFNFLLFHSLVEVAIMSTGFITFAFTWHLRKFELGNLLVIGILLGCTAFMSLFHMLSYKGMGVFEHDANLPTQLWIASRYLLSIFLLLAYMFPGKKIHPYILLSLLFFCTLGVIGYVFSGRFPACFDPVTGQTQFKIMSEYIISGILIVAMSFYWKQRSAYPTRVNWLIMIFFGFSILTELVFTSYLGVYDLSNMLGHVFHFIGSYFLYKAIVETGLENPFELMFKNLNNAVKTRDEFISMASHELKTPLTPLKLQLQMFERELMKNLPPGKSEDQIVKLIRSSNQHIDRLNQLIDGMLDVSRLSTGRFEISRNKVELSNMISTLAKRHEAQILAVASKLNLKLAPLEIDADQMRMEQVITNLLMNALKYAPASSIEIGVEKIDEHKTRIWVSDTGPGISKEFMGRIFNRYERGIPNTSIGGLGLGLYISRQIIEAHGGTLTVESETGKGARFVIEL